MVRPDVVLLYFLFVIQSALIRTASTNLERSTFFCHVHLGVEEIFLFTIRVAI